MRCPKCSKPSEVVKVYQFPAEARRRRECGTCGFRFTTSEKVWRRVYAEELRPRPSPKPRAARAEPQGWHRARTNFDQDFGEDYGEDVRTFVHIYD